MIKIDNVDLYVHKYVTKPQIFEHQNDQIYCLNEYHHGSVTPEELTTLRFSAYEFINIKQNQIQHNSSAKNRSGVK